MPTSRRSRVGLEVEALLVHSPHSSWVIAALRSRSLPVGIAGHAGAVGSGSLRPCAASNLVPPFDVDFASPAGVPTSKVLTFTINPTRSSLSGSTTLSCSLSSSPLHHRPPCSRGSFPCLTRSSFSWLLLSFSPHSSQSTTTWNNARRRKRLYSTSWCRGSGGGGGERAR